MQKPFISSLTRKKMNVCDPGEKKIENQKKSLKEGEGDVSRSFPNRNRNKRCTKAQKGRRREPVAQ